MELYIYAYFPMYYGFICMLANITVNHINRMEEIIPRANQVLDTIPKKERIKFQKLRRIKMILVSIACLLYLTAVVNQTSGYEVDFAKNIEIFSGLVFLLASYIGLYYPKIVKKYIESIPGN